MTITGGTALSKDEIDRMVKEAEAFAAEDHKRREAAEARNQADQLTYQVETFLKDNGDKLSDADKADLTSKNDELKQALKDESADVETLRSASEALMQAWQRVSQQMHEAAQTQATAGGGDSSETVAPEAEADEDDVVEGEIVDEGGAS